MTNDSKSISPAGIIGKQRRSTNAAASYIASLPSKESQRSQAQALKVIAGLLTGVDAADPFHLPWEGLRFEHTQAIRSELMRRYKPATVNRFLVALRRTLKEAWRLELMTREDFARAADLETVKAKSLPAGRELSAAELAALLESCANDSSPAGARDMALIAILYTCGLRRAEVVLLEMADYDPNDGSLKVLGKRQKERYVFATNETGDALRAWLGVRGSWAGPLFVRIRKGDKITRERLTPQAVCYILKERARQANIKEAFSPHDMRRTFVSDLLEAGADISLAAQLAGHESTDTTKRYDRRGEQFKREAQELLHLPYKQRPSDG
jgi:site-specific recombinase XerD